MILDMEAEANRLEDLAVWATEDALDALDDAVHDEASQQASEINNQGCGEQIRWLLSQGCEPAFIEQLLRGGDWD